MVYLVKTGKEALYSYEVNGPSDSLSISVMLQSTICKTIYLSGLQSVQFKFYLLEKCKTVHFFYFYFLPYTP